MTSRKKRTCKNCRALETTNSRGVRCLLGYSVKREMWPGDTQARPDDPEICPKPLTYADFAWWLRQRTDA